MDTKKQATRGKLELTKEQTIVVSQYMDPVHAALRDLYYSLGPELANDVDDALRKLEEAIRKMAIDLF